MLSDGRSMLANSHACWKSHTDLEVESLVSSMKLLWQLLLRTNHTPPGSVLPLSLVGVGALTTLFVICHSCRRLSTRHEPCFGRRTK